MTSLQLTDLTFFRGRVALFAILKALDIAQGDQVAIQAFTCVAVPEAILAAGAQPKYVDIGPEGVNMDPADLDQKITSKTRAIIVQHTFGIPSDMDQIMGIAERTGLPVIEDCCHTILSTFKGRKVGTFGMAGFYSFEWGKPIVVGIGGSALVKDSVLREKIEHSYVDYQLPSVANNIRLQLQYAAYRILYRPAFFWPIRTIFHLISSLGVAESNYNPIQTNGVTKDFALRMSVPLHKRLERKLKNLVKQTDHSSWVSREYQARINTPGICYPELPANSETVFARYPLLVNNKADLLTKARTANVELADWYSTPVHPLADQDLQLVGYETGSCPIAEERCKQVVSIPTNLTVKKRDIDRAVHFLNNYSM